jgi:hypothetical protein
MRYLGKEYDGEGVTVAVIDSGIDKNDPRLAGARIDGWSVTLNASGHALLGPDFHDEQGRGTELAVAIHRVAPKAHILGVKIMAERRQTSAEFMGAGIESASLHGAHVINLSVGTPNMNKALRLRECCGQAVDRGSVVVAAAHPKGERVYPAELPEAVAVASHPDCPIDKWYFFDPERFPRKIWPSLTDKFLAHGHSPGGGRRKAEFIGPGMAAAHLSGVFACLREALPHLPAPALVHRVRELSLVPMPELGYA